MSSQNKSKNLIKLALVATTLTANIAPIITVAIPSAQAVSVTAKRADDFIDSVCVNTKLSYDPTPYVKQFNTVKQKLIEMGVRHIRDGGTTRDWVFDRYKELAAEGIKTNYVMTPNSGVAPNSSYWVKGDYFQIRDLIKNKIGTDVIDSVEIANEIDLNYSQLYWRNSSEPLNNNPASSLYWVKYITSLTKDTWNTLKSDPATKHIKVIGPSLGITYDRKAKSPLPDLSAVVDWGNFHPYPFAGNPYTSPTAYGTLNKYYYDGNFPSIVVDEVPIAFDLYSPPFGSKPMAATETGYFTNTNRIKGIDETVHGKYMPRLFLEYFRKGIARTCSYEFMDSRTSSPTSTGAEGHFGLLRNDLTPKPAYTAVKNLIARLQDAGSNAKTFTPGALDYTLTVTPQGDYTRTKYVHSLLLQKSTKLYYLVLWHEISNNDITVKPARVVANIPTMPTTITVNTPLSKSVVMVSTFDDKGNRTETARSMNNNTLTVGVTDKVTIVKITP